MKYKLSKAAGEQYYSTIFKPVTEKLEETIEPSIRHLAEERMLPPPVSHPTAVPEAIEYRHLQAPEEEEFEEAPEVKHIGPTWEYRPDEGIDGKVLKEYNYKFPSEYKDSNKEEITNVIGDVGQDKRNIKATIKKLKAQSVNLDYIISTEESGEEKTEHLKELNEVNNQIKDLEKDHKNLSALNERLKGMRGYIKTGEGAGRRLYKVKQNGKYGSSYIDSPLLQKPKDISCERWSRKYRVKWKS